MNSQHGFCGDDDDPEHDEDSSPDGLSFEKVVARIVSVNRKLRPAAKDRFLDRLHGDRALTRSAVVVGVALLRELMWCKGMTDKLGFADLAQRCGISRSSVSRAIKQLEKEKHIIVRRSKITAKQNAINQYTLPHLLS